MQGAERKSVGFRTAGRHMYRVFAGIIGDIVKIECLSGSVQMSTCQGLDLPDKQAEIGNPRVWRKNRRCLFRKKGVPHALIRTDPDQFSIFAKSPIMSWLM